MVDIDELKRIRNIKLREERDTEDRITDVQITLAMLDSVIEIKQWIDRHEKAPIYIRYKKIFDKKNPRQKIPQVDPSQFQIIGKA